MIDYSELFKKLVNGVMYIKGINNTDNINYKYIFEQSISQAKFSYLMSHKLSITEFGNLCYNDIKFFIEMLIEDGDIDLIYDI